MNRAQRRTDQRKVIAALRADGCTCRPDFTTDPSVGDGMPDARESGRHRHQPGCPLGRLLAIANLARHLPTIVVSGTPECER